MSKHTKDHMVAIQVLTIDKKLSETELKKFLKGSDFRLVKWGQFSERDDIFRGHAQSKSINGLTMSFREGLYMVKIQDRVFKPVTAEVLFSSWGIIA